MKKRTNIKDIALASGVSITTVSLIFNNKANSIPQETIDRVKQITKEKGYQPNAIASSLKTKKTKMIGYVMPSIENNFIWLKLLKGLKKLLVHTDITLLFVVQTTSLKKTTVL